MDKGVYVISCKTKWMPTFYFYGISRQDAAERFCVDNGYIISNITTTEFTAQAGCKEAPNRFDCYLVEVK